jgi:hypothetical protein
MLRTSSTLAALLAAGTCAALLASPAGAEERTFRDAPEKDANAIDIRRITVDHGTDRARFLEVDVRLRAVTSGDGVSFYLDTDPADAGPEYVLTGVASSEYDFRAVETWGDRGSLVDCDGDRMRLVQDSRRGTVVVPLRCLGRPGDVRVAVKAERSEPSRSRDWAKGPRRWLGSVSRG